MKDMFRFLVTFFFVAWHVAVMATSISRSSGLLSLESMVADADAVIEIEVTGATMKEARVPEVLYRISVTRVIAGAVSPGTCIEGPRGMRVGSRYLAFVESARNSAGAKVDGCASIGTLGDWMPRALEIIVAPEGEGFVRLDNERIVYPRFPGTLPVNQEVTDHGKSSTLAIGSWAPLDGVLEYVHAVRNRADER